MARQGCANVTLDTHNYSAPMPAVGLYIAGGSLVCLLLMICDIFYAYRRRRSWIPCRFFQFNSFTLTILSVATKLQVDLTTSMPTALDQLSKLCGTQLMCICIAFMTPSTAGKKYSENLANLASLAVMVITVIVNICMQMATGVIFSFKIEHIVTLIFMFLLLVILGLSVCHPFNYSLAPSGKLLEKDKKSSMLKGLERCYAINFGDSSGLNFFKFTCYATMGSICIGCLITVSIATVKTFSLEKSKICVGFSDYKWSMPIVILTQLLTLAVGGIAIGFRSLSLVSHTDITFFRPLRLLDINFFYSIKFLVNKRMYLLRVVFHRLHIGKVSGLLEGLAQVLVYIMYMWFGLIDLVVMLAHVPVEGSFACIGKIFIGISKDRRESGEMNTIEELSNDIFLFGLRQGIRKQWKMMIKKQKRNSSAQFTGLLSQNSPSMQPPDEITPSIQPPDEIPNSCLQLVLLVRTIVALTQSSLGESVLHALEETFEIIYFVDEATRMEVKDRKRRMFAKDIWLGRRYKNHWFQKEFIEPIQKLIRSSSQTTIGDETFGGFVKNYLKKNHEVSYILRIFNDHRSNESMEELCAVMKQNVANILSSHLKQFPEVLFNYISGSPIQELEERIELALKFLGKLNLIDSGIPWSLPEGEDIIRFCTQVEDNESSDGDDADARMSSVPAQENATDEV